MKTVKFYTLGCKVNQYETQSIREQFMRFGFQELEDSRPCDIYLVNTCTVTHRADSDSFNLIRRAKRENPKAKIIVTGCLAELDQDKIKKIDGMSLIVKNKDKNRILGFLSENNAINEHNGLNDIGITNFSGHSRAFLKIQDGCNNHCAYCKVSLVRGSSRSRPLDGIIREARELVENGFKEIVLCGICLGAYGKDSTPRIDLMDVIEKLENIEGLLRIRLSSIELGDISDRLIQEMAQSKKLCRHLHIPLQSGDNDILKKMKRTYTNKEYLSLISRIKSCIAEIAITTDILVGFPAENETNFNHTINLIKEILPLKTHIFPYSKREGTEAFKLKGEIKPIIIKQRVLQLKRIVQECSVAYRKQFLNKTAQVLIEGRCKDGLRFWQGHTDNYLKVKVPSGLNLKDQVVTVKLKKIIDEAILAEFC